MEGDSLRSPSPLTQDTNRKAYLSDCRQRPKRCSVQELSQSVNSGCHFSSITFELVLPPCKATSTKCEVHNNLFHGSKTSVKWHFTAQISQAERKSWEGVRSAHPHRSHRTPISKLIRAIVGNVLTDIQSDFQANRSTLATTFPP